MNVNKRLVMIALGVCGVALGVAFGIGVAYGRGDPKTVQSGLTEQQIASLLGGGGGGNNLQRGLGGSGAPQLLGNNTIGSVTAIDGQTVTVKTAQAEVKVALDSATKVSKYGSSGQLAVGDTVVVAGERQADGSVKAASISQMPPELAALAGGGGNFSRPGAAATPAP
jgi:hypothetical protein